VLSALQCDPQVYDGVQHCTADNGDTHVIVVDLNDPHVRVQTVLPMGPNGECNSVNHSGKDGSSNCPSPYPFETVASMLGRYVGDGAVAIINTDYFGRDGDHGAQGLAVRNGERLDGLAHNDDDSGAFLGSTQPSVATSNLNIGTIGIPGSEEVINDNLSGIYYNSVGGAPLIVQGGVVVNSDCTFPYPGDTCSQLAQSAAGLTDDGRLVLITAKKNAEGIASFLITNYHVHTALKFDGGGSARLAWLDSAGEIQSYGATGEDRPVAEGLLVFSIAGQPPSAPSLSSPCNDQQFVSCADITLDWDESDGATEYQAKYEGPSSRTSDWMSGTSWNVDSLTPGDYSWQARAKNEWGESPWKEPSCTFRVNSNQAPTTPSPQSPGDGAWVNNRTVTLQWQASSDDGCPRGITYNVEIWRSGWSNGVRDHSSTSWQVTVPSDDDYQ